MVLFGGFHSYVARLERTAWLAVEAGDLDEAQASAHRALSLRSNSELALVVSGRVATERHEYEKAVSYYARLKNDASEVSQYGYCLAGNVLLFQLGRLSDAERYFDRALQHNPDQLDANERLGMLLAVSSRRWEATPHLLRAVSQGRVQSTYLFMLGGAQTGVRDSKLMEKCRALAPEDLGYKLGLASVFLSENHQDRAKALIREVLLEKPDHLSAHALLGQTITDFADKNEFNQWHRQLPTNADLHPSIWHVRGLWAKAQGDLKGAARCLVESLERDPGNGSAIYALAQLLLSLDEPELSHRTMQRARLLSEYADCLYAIHADDSRVATKLRGSELAETLGLVWEAWGWAQIALEQSPDDQQLAERSKRLLAEAREVGLNRLKPGMGPVEKDLFADYPLPRWSPPQDDSSTQVVATRSFRFEDEAERTGIQFSFYNAVDLDSDGMHIWQTTGSGVAIIDYDGDGWPDIYFTQGAPWPVRDDQREYQDRLYRNLGNGRFVDVTAATGLGDNRFSQGVAAGDYNNDGHTDLYVANIGGNRLYRNNGDGTFDEVTVEVGVSEEQWTSSCMIADLNDDGLPDIYDVNYLLTQQVFSRSCKNPSGKTRACMPGQFEAAQDELWINLGNGRFRAGATSAGIEKSNGKGLGILAADFSGNGALGVFVANDTVQNFYFTPGATDTQAGWFSEQGLLSGLAVDSNGNPQACMGIAAADANGDGLIDLFVTNFYQESNTLYVQHESGSFVDSTRQSGLASPSFDLLGFGTQFIDGDLDGWPDLVITNGHVDDFRDEGIPYRMRPQFLRNLGEGKFAEIPPEALGAFFQRGYLGRGLARVDWNRDGREDFVVGHVFSPASLVTNRTEDVGHFLTIQLCGVQSDRDAIGATVYSRVGDRVLTRQLTAGDGYMASNHRQLVIGLGPARQVDELIVRWRSGNEQTWKNVPGNREIIIYEGRPELHPLSF